MTECLYCILMVAETESLTKERNTIINILHVYLLHVYISVGKTIDPLL